MVSSPSQIDPHSFSTHLDETVGNAVYDASYSILSIPFTLLINLTVLQIFETSNRQNGNTFGLQKVSTWNSLGKGVLKTALTTASAAPLIFLSQHITSHLGYSQLRRVKHSISSQLVEHAITITLGTLIGQVLSSIHEVANLLAEG